jgi:hypothetical protein
MGTKAVAAEKPVAARPGAFVKGPRAAAMQHQKAQFDKGRIVVSAAPAGKGSLPAARAASGGMPVVPCLRFASMLAAQAGRGRSW